MTTNIHRRASDVLTRTRLGYAGQTLLDGSNRERDAVNVDGASKQVETCAITNVAGGTDDFEVTIERTSDGESYTFSTTTSAGATTNDLAAAELADLWNKDPEATQFAWASASTSNLILTAVWPGTDYAFTVTDGGATLTATPSTTTAAADASEIKFGRVALTANMPASDSYLSGLDPDGFVTRPGQSLLKAAKVANLTAQVSTIVVGGVWEDAKTARIYIRDLVTGFTEQWEVDSVTSLNATASAINAALNGFSQIVTSAVNTATVTLTAITKGHPFEVTVVELDASTITYTVATTTETTSIEDLIAGVVLYKPTMYDTTTLGEAATGVPANEEAILLEEGFVFVQWSGAAPDRNDPVYVKFATDATQGRVYNTSGSDRYQWKRARWTGVARDNVAVLQILAR